MAGHGSPPPQDRGSHPGRQVGRLTWQPSSLGTPSGGRGVEVGTTKHWAPEHAWEDEMGAVETVREPSGRHTFEATHYDPYERDPRDREAGWRTQQGSFSVRTPQRAKIAGEALLNRMRSGRA